MTDNEIISKLKKQADYNCDCCSVYYANGECGDCPVYITRHSLDLIYKQRAEIDRLKTEMEGWRDTAYHEASQCEAAEVAAIKNFVMKLKIYVLNPNKDFFVTLDEIDKLAEETIGDAYEHN